tara:strand:- start:194 stop:637 length:444 start_codon:yes stop_codon:yes gene_type:complete
MASIRRDIIDALKTKLETISGLTVHKWMPSTPSTRNFPIAIIDAVRGTVNDGPSSSGQTEFLQADVIILQEFDREDDSDTAWDQLDVVLTDTQQKVGADPTLGNANVVDTRLQSWEMAQHETDPIVACTATFQIHYRHKYGDPEVAL